MTVRRFVTIIASVFVLWALVICVCLSRAEFPVVRKDTVYLPHLTPASAWLDSVVRVDSLKARKR